MALPRELSAFFKRRLHALGSKRHWKKRFRSGQYIDRQLLENAAGNDRRKFVAWAMANGGVYDCSYDGIRMQRLGERKNPAISGGGVFAL